MRRRAISIGVAAVWVGLAMLAPPATGARGPEAPAAERRPAQSERAAELELRRLAHESLVLAGERQQYRAAAAHAWRYVDRHYQPATGLVDGAASWPYTTVWDVASGLGAMYAGHELSLIDTATYDRRVHRTLATLASIPLYDGAAFNKLYSTRTGAMVGRNQSPSEKGIGWSALDVGRLLVWLHILSVKQPRFREEIEQVVSRLAMDRLVVGGYLQGEDLDEAGKPRRYQEGRIGYEQYAARGFAAWGAAPSRALRLTENGVPVTIFGRPLLADLRGRDRLTSDPLILLGLELGWDRPTERLAVEFLAAQEARHRQTGVVTLAAEDAVDHPPHFFYYYCALTRGRDFGLDVQDPHAVVEQPRWVSAKAAFAWHVLRPSAYTHLALATVAPARIAGGWSSGVYEKSGAPTGTLNINTAGVILTAALVHARGGPVLEPAREEEP